VTLPVINRNYVNALLHGEHVSYTATVNVHDSEEVYMCHTIPQYITLPCGISELLALMQYCSFTGKEQAIQYSEVYSVYLLQAISHQEDLRVDGRIILKLIIGWERVEWTQLAQLGHLQQDLVHIVMNFQAP
jgi:hypothetical protein